MDKDTKDLGLFRIRSVGACVRDGYRLYLDRFRKYFRSTWLIAAVYAVLAGLIVTMTTSVLPIRQTLENETLQRYLPLALALLYAAVTIAMLFVMGRRLLKRSDEKPKSAWIPPRYAGGMLLLLLVVVIVTIVLALLTELPAFILLAAGMVSQAGAMRGDPTGMPDYMLWMNIVVFTLAGFIRAYIYLSALFPLYFLYGSVETQERERNELVNSL